MRIRMLVGTGGPNGIACEVGEVYDLPDQLAQSWIYAGRAVCEDRAPVVDGGITPVHGDPVVSVAAPPARRRR